jgi:hypothetical protein
MCINPPLFFADFLGMVTVSLNRLEFAKKMSFNEKLTGNRIKSGMLGFEVTAQNFPEPSLKHDNAVMLCVDLPFHFRMNESLDSTEERFFPDVQTALSYAKQTYPSNTLVHIVIVCIDPIDVEKDQKLKKEIATSSSYNIPMLTSQKSVVFDRANTSIYGPLEFGCKQHFHVINGITNLCFYDIIFSSAGSSHNYTQLFLHPESQVYLERCTIRGDVMVHNSLIYMERCAIHNTYPDSKACITIGELYDDEKRESYLKNQLSPVIKHCTFVGKKSNDIGIYLRHFTFVLPSKNPNLLLSSHYVDIYHRSDFGTRMANTLTKKYLMFQVNRVENCEMPILVEDVANIDSEKLKNQALEQLNP